MIDASLLVVASLVLAIVALVWAITLQFRLARMADRYQRLMAGVGAGNLEEVIAGQVGRIGDHERRLAEHDQGLMDLSERLRSAVQRVGLVRFNPFKETGGDLSFAVALLDERRNGVVISSLHSRAETRVYAKPIQAGASPYTLSDEESEALKQASAAPAAPIR